jgi:hypothetical protein
VLIAVLHLAVFELQQVFRDLVVDHFQPAGRARAGPATHIFVFCDFCELLDHVGSLEKFLEFFHVTNACDLPFQESSINPFEKTFILPEKLS